VQRCNLLPPQRAWRAARRVQQPQRHRHAAAVASLAPPVDAAIFASLRR